MAVTTVATISLARELFFSALTNRVRMYSDSIVLMLVVALLNSAIDVGF
jgi:hypothetical protein